MEQINASKLQRIMQCGASRNMPGSTRSGTSDEANEGDFAHDLAMHILRGNKVKAGETFRGQVITQEMLFYIHKYTDGLPPGIVERDITLTLGDYVLVARPDWYRVTGNTLYIKEFKYGFGIVEPEMNWQMLCEAIILLAKHTDSVNEIEMTIVQPRAWHAAGIVRTWAIDTARLAAIQQDMIMRLMMYANVLASGPECGYCPSQISCPTARKAGYNAIDVAEQMHSDNYGPGEIAAELPLLERAIKALTDRKKALDNEATHLIKSGTYIPGYHLKTGLGNRAWKPYVNKFMLAAIAPGIAVSEDKLITPAKLEQAGVSEDAIKLLTDRPNTGFSLAKGDPTERLK